MGWAPGSPWVVGFPQLLGCSTWFFVVFLHLVVVTRVFWVLGYWWFGLFLGLPVVFGCWLVSCGCGFGGFFVAEGAVAGAAEDLEVVEVVGAAFAVWGDVVGFDAVGLSWLVVVEVGVAAGAVFESVVFGLLYEAGSVAEVGAGAGAAGCWSHFGSWSVCCWCATSLERTPCFTFRF